MLNFKEIAAKGHSVHWLETLDGIRGRDEPHKRLYCGTIAADLVAEPVSGVLKVQGKLQAALELTCSRCLEPFTWKQEIPFCETFVRKPDHADFSDDGEIRSISEDQLDLAPYIAENVLLALPYAPLCAEDCRGLCPVCGGNRNTAACECRQESTDPRLAGLAELFKS